MEKALKKTFEPLPELLEPSKSKPWKKIRSQGASVNVPLKIYESPFDDSKQSRGLRCHEYSHIKWSPADKPDMGSNVKQSLMEAIEDLRVNELCIKNGVRTIKDITLDECIVPDNPVYLLGCYIVSHHYKGDRSRFNPSNKIGPGVKEYTDSIIREVIIKANGKKDNFKLTLECAEKLYGFLKKRLKEESGKKPPDKKIPKILETDEPFDLDQIEKNTDPDYFLKIIKPGPGRSGKSEKSPTKDPSGKMTIKDLTVLPQCLKMVNLKKPKKTDMGMVFRYPDRILTDKLCFSTIKKHRKIGTILVDCSGSMDINYNQLQNIVKKSNGCMIAGYGAETGEEGTLYLLAQDGKMINSLPRFGPQNVIDVPAGKWLIEQEKPLVWVTDQGFSGVGDRIYQEIKDLCQNLITKNRIKIIKDLDGVESYLKN